MLKRNNDRNNAFLHRRGVHNHLARVAPGYNHVVLDVGFVGRSQCGAIWQSNRPRRRPEQRRDLKSLVSDLHDYRSRLLGEFKRCVALTSFAVFGFALLLLGAPNSAHAQSANVNCSNPAALKGLLNPAFTWTLQAACSSLSTATGATTAVTTIDIAFLT